jgi:hypothetical protein
MMIWTLVSGFRKNPFPASGRVAMGNAASGINFILSEPGIGKMDLCFLSIGTSSYAH